MSETIIQNLIILYYSCRLSITLIFYNCRIMTHSYNSHWPVDPKKNENLNIVIHNRSHLQLWFITRFSGHISTLYDIYDSINLLSIDWTRWFFIFIEIFNNKMLNCQFCPQFIIKHPYTHYTYKYKEWLHHES